jgi:SAM-dependent methyltransferase
VHDETLIGEFTHQAADFNAIPVFSAEETLGALLEIADPQPDERWLETACGTGHISRELAPRVASVQGIDLTPAMLEQAREAAAAEKLANVSFTLGDATALDLPDGELDAAVTRFSLHHIPLPGRVFAELARVVRPGGKVVVADHVTDEDVDAATWHTEIERLRDPSHWANLTPRQLRARGEEAGLRLEAERLIPFGLDFDGWVERSSAGSGVAPLLERALELRPETARSFEVRSEDDRRELRLVYWVSLWRG